MTKTNVIRLAKQYYSCIRNIIIYVSNFTILNLNKKKNDFMRYKFLFVETSYLFQVFSYIYFITRELVITINAIIKLN
jgi:hypothetical protein